MNKKRENIGGCTKRICLILIMVIGLFSCKRTESGIEGNLIGIVFYERNTHYLAIGNTKIPDDLKIQVYTSGKMDDARVMKKINLSDEYQNKINFNDTAVNICFYEIDFGLKDFIGEGLAMIKTKSSVNRDFNIINSLLANKFKKYNWCSSNEGIHYNMCDSHRSFQSS